MKPHHLQLKLSNTEILVVPACRSQVSIISEPTKVMRHQGLVGLCFHLVEVNHTDLRDPSSSLHTTPSHSRHVCFSMVKQAAEYVQTPLCYPQQSPRLIPSKSSSRNSSNAPTCLTSTCCTLLELFFVSSPCSYWIDVVYFHQGLLLLWSPWGLSVVSHFGLKCLPNEFAKQSIDIGQSVGTGRDYEAVGSQGKDKNMKSNFVEWV